MILGELVHNLFSHYLLQDFIDRSRFYLKSLSYWTGTTTLVTRVGKKSFYTHFTPPHPCAMLPKHFHLTQVCILPFSNIEWGNGGVETYSVGIKIMISCFWHFPTQFVQGCSLKGRRMRGLPQTLPIKCLNTTGRERTFSTSL